MKGSLKKYLDLVPQMKELKNKGFGYCYIANKLQISRSSVRRYLDPNDREKNRQYTINIGIPKRRDRVNNDIKYRTKLALYDSERKSQNRKHMKCVTPIDDIVNNYNATCNICKINECDLNRNLVVDHCHITGKFRGWLCGNCNRALGFLQEDINILESALKYLKESNNE